MSRPFSRRIAVFAITGLLASSACAALRGAESRDLLLTTPEAIDRLTPERLAAEGFGGVVLVLAEDFAAEVYRQAAGLLAEKNVPFYYWIEIARNPVLAKQHPEWMASLGMHDDWRKRFPNTPQAKAGEIVKAYPWIPIRYQEAFDLQWRRLEELLARAPGGNRGLLLNDLQGSPSSCGCGNLLCRWATDYQVPATGTAVEPHLAAVRFLERARRRFPGKLVVPVWATECEEADLPLAHRSDPKTTGRCGSVGCHRGACPKEFNVQWQALIQGHDGPIALLALDLELERSGIERAGGTAWPAGAFDYLKNATAKAPGRTAANQLWAVIQGYGRPADQEQALRRAARRSGAATIIVARTRLDQGYEPRLVRVP